MRHPQGLLYAEGSLPLRTLEPGHYLARALVAVGETVVTTVERAFDFEGSGARP